MWQAIIFVIAVGALTTLLGQVPYIFINHAKLLETNAKKKAIKVALKSRLLNEDEYSKHQIMLIKTNLAASRQLIIPLIIQLFIISYALNQLRLANPVPYWFWIYIVSAIVLGRIWAKYVIPQVRIMIQSQLYA